jgi:16S rRNA (uracil1498-N3)-methyltransferase
VPETIRLFVESDLSAGASLALDPAQTHYLMHVLRRGVGDAVHPFNGRDGEWRARIERANRNACTVALLEQVRAQAPEPDLWLAFAPVKRAPIDAIATKATELGVGALCPVLTQHTSVTRVNLQRLRANAIEAAEQCGRLSVPDVHEPVTLGNLIAQWPADRSLMLCDESGSAPPVADALAGRTGGKWAVLIGPEGGFAQSELDALGKLPFVTAVGLGPRLLRADTAAIAALACLQALVGDWRATGGTRP